MNKSELIEKLASQLDVPKTEVGNFLEAFQNIVADELANGGNVALTGFGTFDVRDRAAREGRNPRTGETMQIAASRVPSFKAGKKLRDKVASD